MDLGYMIPIHLKKRLEEVNIYFLIYKSYFYKDLGGGIGFIEMLYKCNILALVGGGKNPKFSQDKVVLWDDHATKPIGELIFKN